jgi:signal transduction histidine kinase
MAGDDTGEANLLDAYRAEISRDKMGPSVRTGSIVLATISTLIIPFDYLLFREQFPAFLALRLVLDVLLVFVFFRLSYSRPLLSAMIGGIAGGLSLLFVIFGTGGPASTYYTGLVVFEIGLPMLLPLSAGQVGSLVSVLLAGYLSSAFLMSDRLEWETFGLNSFFLLAGGFAAIASAAVLDRVRFSDFKRRREVEEARDQLRELDQAKSRFTANIHHELRTPLTLMLAPLDALRSGDFGELPETIVGTLKTMYVNGKRLHKLINNLLDLAKLESHQFKIRRQPMRLRRLVEEVFDGARPLAERKGITLTMEGLEELPEICADSEAVDKVVVNLVGNALKFTERGGRITAKARRVEEGVELRVVDTGMGIPPEKLGKVFDRFAQLDGTATRKYEGTGIGLSLAQELVQLHGGRIWAESEGEGRGTSMCVVLPLGEPDEGIDEEILRTADGRSSSLATSIAAAEAELNLDEEEAAQAAASSVGRLVELERSVDRWEGAQQPATNPQGGPVGSAEILVVEDNPDMRKLLAFLLSREFRVRTARNGREALEALRERPPTLVLSDIMMPEMSGIDLCRAIKEDPATRGIPVVLVTSKAEQEMKIEGLEIGAEDYVTKPFHPRELLARVHALVRVRELQEELAEQNASLDRALAELKKAEIQLVKSERLAAVGELAAGVAHEVNNPVNFALNSLRALQAGVRDLAGVAERLGGLSWSDPGRLENEIAEIQGLGEDLGFEERSKELAELCGIVAEGLARTSRLVGDLRDFAAPGRSERAPVDLGRGLRSTAQLVKQVLAAAKVRLDLQIPDSLPPVLGDAAALNQVFLNLLKNAAEAMDGRGGSIRVDVSVEGGVVAIAFRDDGPGIPQDVRDRLFEPFFTTKKAGKGTGLGLSISRQVAEAQGGSLEVESEPGAGATFTLRLPLSE